MEAIMFGFLVGIWVIGVGTVHLLEKIKDLLIQIKNLMEEREDNG